MRRYASIDFLRGTAIVLMIFLHIISHVLDQNTLLPKINDLPMLQIVAFIILPFLGGLAGFFLMVSAIGNMVSMYRHLQAGKSVRELVMRQVIGGFLLLAFGMLTESTIGYLGATGNLILAIPNISTWNWQVILWRGYHFETISTIAWCIVLNGIVQGILSRNNRWKDTKKMVKNYAILAVIIVTMTPLMWWLADVIVPGYPYATNPNTGEWIMYVYLGKSPWNDYITLFLLGPLAGHPEPVFPYLAASFLGSIVGIWMAQERHEIPKNFPRRLLKLGFWMFFIGLIGVIINVAAVMSVNSEQGLNLYLLLWDHRYWVPQNGVPFLGWLFQFLALNGVGISAIVLVIRLVEFRGKGAAFAAKTTFVRRFGFVAFTLYAYQFMFYFGWLIVSSIFATPYAVLDWNLVFLVEIVSFGIIQIVLLLWERVKYVGSIEWLIAIIAAKIVPGKKPKGRGRDLLAVDGAFYNVEWLNIIEEGEIDHTHNVESRLAARLSLWGFLFPPLSFLTLMVGMKAEKLEKVNRFTRFAKVVSIAGIIFFAVWVIFVSLFSLSTLGISISG